MTTRITAIHNDGAGTVQSHTRTIDVDVDESTARLVGLGLLFDADIPPSAGRETVEVKVVREPACPQSARALIAHVKGAREKAASAQARLTAVETAMTLAGRGPLFTSSYRLSRGAPGLIHWVGLQTRNIGCLLVRPHVVNDGEWTRAIRSAAMVSPFPVIVTATLDSTDYEVYETQAQVLAWVDGLRGQGAVGKPVTDGVGGPTVGRIVGADQRDGQIHARVEIDRVPDGLRTSACVGASLGSQVAADTADAERFCYVPTANRHLSTPGVADALDRWAPLSVREAMREAGVPGWEADSGVSSADAIRFLSEQRDGLSGVSGCLADVLEFHGAVAEHNTYITERNGPAALVRAVSRYSLLEEEFREYTKAMIEGDVVGVLDALIDMAYVIVGTGLIQFGGERFSRAWAEVHRSNMAKRWPDGTFHLREDGKVMKPPGWEAPDLAAIVSSPPNPGATVDPPATAEPPWDGGAR